MPAGTGGDGGAGRRARAKQNLARAAHHLEQCVDDLATLNEDARDIANEILGSEKYSFGSLIADLLALSINAATPLSRCLDGGAQVDRTTTGEGVNPPSEPLTLTFDIRSEMAGPLFVDLGATGVTLVAKTNLVATSGVIGQDRVLVRIDQSQLIVSIRDLRKEKPGTYEGSITLRGTNGTSVQVPIRAICKSTLWWL